MPDVAAVNGGSSNVSVLIGTGAGAFQPAVNYGTGATPSAISVADYNGDGMLDLVVADKGGNSLSLLAGNGKTARSHPPPLLPQETLLRQLWRPILTATGSPTSQ